MASRVGRIAGKICSSFSKGSNCATSASSFAGSRSVPRFCSPHSAPRPQLFGSRRPSLQFACVPGELRCISVLSPRHNVTAAARLVSKLSGDLSPELEGRLARYVSPI